MQGADFSMLSASLTGVQSAQGVILAILVLQNIAMGLATRCFFPCWYRVRLLEQSYLLMRLKHSRRLRVKMRLLRRVLLV